MKGLSLLILLMFSLSCFSQVKEEKVWFGNSCGYSGSETEVVIKFAKLLYDKNYIKIRNSLFSKIPAENFIAVVICKRLAHKNLIELNELELKKIGELYQSKEKVPVCGGCTYSEEVELTKLLNSKKDMFYAIDYYFHDEK